MSESATNDNVPEGEMAHLDFGDQIGDEAPLVLENHDAFNQKLVALLDTLMDAGELDVKVQVKKNLQELCCANTFNYLQAQALLVRLSKESDEKHWGLLLKRISQELAEIIANQPDAQWASEAIQRAADTDLVTSVINFQTMDKPRAGDVLRLPQKLWLLAYASSARPDERGKLDQKLFDDTLKGLNELDTLVTKIKSMAQLKKNIKEFMAALDRPVTSMALLHWLRLSMADEHFYEWSLMRQEPPLAFEILDEIAVRYPLQRPYVAEVWFELFDRQFNAGPVISVEYKERFLERMIFLMKTGYVTPVLNFVKRPEVEENLKAHFVRKLLYVIEAPYSKEIVTSMADIIKPIPVEHFRGTHEHELLSRFLDTAAEPLMGLEGSELELLMSLKELHK
ncbi:Negative elongation factor C/D [Borealophlyctis nickersoniae]|nr:Negative elongation factor C/D [Borealophlyctis nickersoniae]